MLHTCGRQHRQNKAHGVRARCACVSAAQQPHMSLSMPCGAKPKNPAAGLGMCGPHVLHACTLHAASCGYHRGGSRRRRTPPCAPRAHHRPGPRGAPGHASEGVPPPSAHAAGHTRIGRLLQSRAGGWAAPQRPHLQVEVPHSAGCHRRDLELHLGLLLQSLNGLREVGNPLHMHGKPPRC